MTFCDLYDVVSINKNTRRKDKVTFSGEFKSGIKKKTNTIIKTLNFPDHYNYSNSDISKIKETAKNLKTKIITTEKDYNRLNKLNAEGIDFLKIELKILNENQLINFLNKKL